MLLFEPVRLGEIGRFLRFPGPGQQTGDVGCCLFDHGPVQIFPGKVWMPQPEVVAGLDSNAGGVAGLVELLQELLDGVAVFEVGGVESAVSGRLSVSTNAAPVVGDESRILKKMVVQAFGEVLRLQAVLQKPDPRFQDQLLVLRRHELLVGEGVLLGLGRFLRDWLTW